LGFTDPKERDGGLGIPDLRDLNLCLLASWVNRYQAAPPRLWKNIIDHKYPTAAPTFCAVRIARVPLFGKGSCGLLRQLGWGMHGRWVMVEKSSFERTNGLIVVALQSNIGTSILL
jgi:hypothetical protein